MCDSKKIRDTVFKKKLLRRLYGNPEETETSTKQEQSILDPETETDTDRTSVAAKYTCRVIPKKKVYSVIPRPPGVLPDKDSLLEEEPEFVGEEKSESESEEEVKKRRRRKRKQRSDDPLGGQREKAERISGGAANQILTKNQKRKLKKKKRKEREKLKNPGESQKGFTYSVDTNEEVSNQLNKSRREELCGRLPKLMEFVRAVWEVYDQDVAVKDTKHHEKNMDKLLNQVASISNTEEEAVLSEFDGLWHLKTLLVLADHSRAEEKIKHLENITTVAIDNESRDLMCTLMRYWITDVANQR